MPDCSWVIAVLLLDVVDSTLSIRESKLADATKYDWVKEFIEPEWEFNGPNEPLETEPASRLTILVITSEPLNVNFDPLIFNDPVKPIALAAGTNDPNCVLPDLNISDPDNSVLNLDIGLFYSSIML